MSNSFEKDFERVKKIIGELEKGAKPLSETMKLFEEGMKLTDKCKSYLEEAELVVEELDR